MAFETAAVSDFATLKIIGSTRRTRLTAPRSVLLLIILGWICTLVLTGCDQDPQEVQESSPAWENLGLAPLNWHRLEYQEPYLYVLANQDGEPDAVEVARPVRRAGRGNPSDESLTGRPGPTLHIS
jgi:hypothetical protein